MVKQILRWAVILTVIVGLGWLAYTLWPTPGKQVRKRLDQLAQLASISPLEVEETRQAKARALADLFALDAVIRVDVQGGMRGQVAGREEIAQVALGARTMLGVLSVEFLDVVVRVSDDQRSATVEATGKATQPGVREVFWQELKFEYVLRDGQWFIRRVETVRTLTRQHHPSRHEAFPVRRS